jgi:hypothetical protein
MFGSNGILLYAFDGVEGATRFLEVKSFYKTNEPVPDVALGEGDCTMTRNEAFAC